MSLFLNKDESDLIRIIFIKYFRLKEKKRICSTITKMLLTS